MRFHPEALRRLIQFKESDQKIVGLDLLILFLESEREFRYKDMANLFYSFKNNDSTQLNILSVIKKIISDNFVRKKYICSETGVVQVENKDYDMFMKNRSKNDLFLITLKDRTLIHKYFKETDVLSLLEEKRKKTVLKHFSMNNKSRSTDTGSSFDRLSCSQLNIVPQFVDPHPSSRQLFFLNLNKSGLKQKMLLSLKTAV